MKVKWPPFCNFRGPFFKKGGPPKGYLNLLVQSVPWENEHLLKLSFMDSQVLNMRLK